MARVDRTGHGGSPRRVALAVLTLCALGVPSGVAGASSADPPPVIDAPAIDGWVEQRMAAHGIPGAAVAVVRGGEVVHLAGYGVADPGGSPVTADTPFLIGSVSKPFTAVVVRQLVDEGLLSWDEPVWPHLAHLTDTPPAGFVDATVEQLLDHTAGLGMSVGVAGAVRTHDGPDALDRRAADLLASRSSFPAGEGWEYSNAGPTLLAVVVEQVTGRRFADELRDRVFDPLEMTGTFARVDDPRAAALATGHQLWFGRWRPAALPYDPAGIAMGYIGSTARDLAAFTQAHLDGHPTIVSTAADIARGPVVPTGWDTPLDAGYGRGWFVDELDGLAVVSHTGSLGHFTGHVLMIPEADGLGIAVLTNASAFISAGHEGQYDLGLGLTHLLLGEDPRPAGRSFLLAVIVPVAAWVLVVLLAGHLAVHLLRRSHRRTEPGTRRDGPVRLLLTGGALLAVGTATFLAAPLGVARHFYPDAGFALTAFAYVALVGGIARLLVAVLAVGRERGGTTSARATSYRAEAATEGRACEGTPAGHGHGDRG